VTVPEVVIPEGPDPHGPQTRQERIDYGRSVLDARSSVRATGSW
jgi:hypothetical protein